MTASTQTLCPPPGCAAGRCPLCGGPNACREASTEPYKGPCWCERRSFPEALLALVPRDAVVRACICERCLVESQGFHTAPEETTADSYRDPETGCRVFTAEYLRRRGECCDSGCRHCPWDQNARRVATDPNRSRQREEASTRLPLGNPKPEQERPVTSTPAGFPLGLAVLALWMWLAPHGAAAATLTEEFGSDPLDRGWLASGRTNLYAWDSAAQRLEVTWDSSAPHSLFALPLGETLTTNESFAFGLDLVLTEAEGGVRPPRSGAMQVAFGLLDLPRALREHYPRAAGRAFDLVEFNWFPPGEIPGFGVVDPTVSPVLFDSAGHVAASFTFPLELTLGVPHRIRCEFDRKQRELRTTLISGGVEQPVRRVTLPAAFADFSLNAFALMNWSEADSPFDSVLARGHVDRIVIELPPPPIGTVEMTAPGEVSFAMLGGWQYDVEASEDLVRWRHVLGIAGSEGRARVPDHGGVPSGRQFYRVRATRVPKPGLPPPP